MPKRTKIAHLDDIGQCMLFSNMVAFFAVRSDCIYNNSESLNVTALPHIKIHCSLTNILGGIMVRGFQDCHFGSHVSYKHIMIYAILYLHVALMTPYNPAYGSDEMSFEREL